MIRAEYTIPGLHVREHEVQAPLDWADSSDPARITVFAREVVDPVRRNDDLPLLLFLQGGPGGKSPRPTGPEGWIGEAIRTHRVILLDQRGTGRSSRIEGRRLEGIGDAAAQAAFLACFRADSIVADAELLRTSVFGGRRWSTLGQSYGGFVTLAYLSRAPEGLAACYVTGGLPSIRPDAAEVYRRTFPRIAGKNRAFAERYPQHVESLARIADRLAAGDVRLPSGDALTVRRLQHVGLDLGMGAGFERLHYLFDEAFADDGELTTTFLAQVETATAYSDNPLFAALHESIYASGPDATAWAAQAELERRPEFADDARPLLLTGESIHPWMFEEIRALRPFRGAVEHLAARADWPELYDAARLAANEVPVVAAVYVDDMYVDADLQHDTLAALGNARHLETNEFEHDGLRVGDVFARLRRLLDAHGGARASSTI
ncbi:alpha/beta fold hydrolase [Agromyces seonyuensis]|uniref:Alpha/beta fold hydrolase n=1 Tax=Agromyces seonyuensis TaxID=2662446 RepID=A0A6I4P372_9MICO|nr:alpha/beta fold hydrolase [Agromyces seonyuensis]MWB97757.1 alpha/beta fold hydrolase [Agromyces seonyuensis]